MHALRKAFGLVTLLYSIMAAPIAAHAQSFDSIMSAIPLVNMTQLSGIDPSTFLGEVQSLVKGSNARDLASLGKQAAKVALRVEELQISVMQSTLCTSGTVTSNIPAQYTKDVKLGCDLLSAQSELNKLKQKMLTHLIP